MKVWKISYLPRNQFGTSVYFCFSRKVTNVLRIGFVSVKFVVGWLLFFVKLFLLRMSLFEQVSLSHTSTSIWNFALIPTVAPFRRLFSLFFFFFVRAALCVFKSFKRGGDVMYRLWHFLYARYLCNNILYHDSFQIPLLRPIRSATYHQQIPDCCLWRVHGHGIGIHMHQARELIRQLETTVRRFPCLILIHLHLLSSEGRKGVDGSQDWCVG